MKKFMILTAVAVMAMGVSAYASDTYTGGCVKISDLPAEINICSDIDINELGTTYNNICKLIDDVQSGKINCDTIIMELIKQNCNIPCDKTTECTTKAKPDGEPTTEATTQAVTEKPTQPATEKPTQPTTEKATQPTTEKPVQPTTEKPTQPTTEKPVQPTTEKVTQPTTVKPVQPTTEKVTQQTTNPQPTTEKATQQTTKPQPTIERTTEATTSAPANNSSEASALLSLVNKARAENGLSLLSFDSSLSAVAQKKAEDMKKNNYFSHTSPTYGSPFDMIKSAGISYKTAGENIAKGQKDAQTVFDAWMNSSGHRANILNQNYTRMGLGVTSGSGRYWSQMFIG